MTAVADEADPLAAAAPLILDHLNDDHADSLLLVARAQGGHPEATGARAVGVDRLGLDLVVDDATAAPVRVAFGAPAEDTTRVREEAVALVAEAKAITGSTGPTTFEAERAAMNTIPTWITRVVRVEPRSPHLRRITFGGGDLDRYAPKGPDQFLYVLLPPPGRTDLTVDQSFTWEACWAMPEDERPVGAYYTVRAHRPDVGEIDVDFVLHGDGVHGDDAPGDGGHASRWASRAEPGDPVALWGPREAFAPPPGTDRYLLVADETGLPAVGAILDALPPGTPATVIVEVAEEAERQPLRDDPAIDVTWIHRDGAEAGTTTHLVDAVRALPSPGPTTYAWGGGESRAVTAVRRHLRQEVGLPREAVSMTGYWRHAGTRDDEVEND